MTLAPLRIRLACEPPNITAQQKGVRVIRGRARFFHTARMQRQEMTWRALLQPHVPAEPLVGAIAATIVGVWPHTANTSKRAQPTLTPKLSRPDASNFTKHFEDLLVKMRFLEEDSHVVRLVVEKWRGSTDNVGLYLELEQLTSAAAPCLPVASLWYWRAAIAPGSEGRHGR